MQWVVCSEINSYLENAKLCSSVVYQIGSKYELDFLKWSGRNWSCIHILFLTFPYSEQTFHMR